MSSIRVSKDGYALILSVLGLPALPCAAQWSVVRLAPNGSTFSKVLGGYGDTAVGYATFAGADHASVWSNGGASWTDLNPSGAFSRINGATSGTYVGESNGHATVWDRGTGTRTDLNPAQAAGSSAYAGVDGYQGGQFRAATGSQRAALWSGTASSMVELTVPTGNCVVLGMSANQQVGFVETTENHAALWSGTASSYVDLNPVGSLRSKAYGISQGRQAGSANVFDGSIYPMHAGIWNGTASSWIDMHPAVARESEALAICDGMEVGDSLISGTYHASFWSGTAASWVDLHTFAASQYFATYATSIWKNGGFTYVGGYGYSRATSHTEALLWVIPAPSTASVLTVLIPFAARRRRR